MDKKSIKFTRKGLYDEIWAISLSGVVKKYGLSYTKLVQVCKTNDIPYPSTAYWSKKNMGLDFSDEIVELPDNDIIEVEIPLKYTGTLIEDNINDKDKFINEFSFLNFLSDNEKKCVANVIYDLNINKFTRNHKVIIDYKNKKKEERKKEREANYYNPYYSIHDYKENGYFQNVSKFEKERCMKILSLIYFSIEKLGGTINEDFSLQIRGEHVELEVEELKDQVKHELTKEEAKQLLEYEERKKTFSYASKPNIRKYDYVYNGKLKISCGNRKYIRENDKIKLEDKLGDIIIKLYEQSEEARIERIKREEIERKIQEEEKQRKELEKMQKTEAQKVIELINKAEDYKMACEIREYIQAVISKDSLNLEIQDWVKWARKKADWIDPTICANDEVLGERNHGESKKNKYDQLERYATRFIW